jgi:hypothetical protein
MSAVRRRGAAGRVPINRRTAEVGKEIAMKLLAKFSLMVVLVVGLAGTAHAKKNKGGGDPGVNGTVVKVDGKNLVLKTDAGETTITTDDSTAVVINGTPSKLSDLKADQTVKVTPATGTAMRVEVGATDEPAKKKKKAK